MDIHTLMEARSCCNTMGHRTWECECLQLPAHEQCSSTTTHCWQICFCLWLQWTLFPQSQHHDSTCSSSSSSRDKKPQLCSSLLLHALNSFSQHTLMHPDSWLISGNFLLLRMNRMIFKSTIVYIYNLIDNINSSVDLLPNKSIRGSVWSCCQLHIV